MILTIGKPTTKEAKIMDNMVTVKDVTYLVIIVGENSIQSQYLLQIAKNATMRMVIIISSKTKRLVLVSKPRNIGKKYTIGLSIQIKLLRMIKANGVGDSVIQIARNVLDQEMTSIINVMYATMIFISSVIKLKAMEYPVHVMQIVSIMVSSRKSQKGCINVVLVQTIAKFVLMNILAMIALNHFIFLPQIRTNVSKIADIAMQKITPLLGYGNALIA